MVGRISENVGSLRFERQTFGVMDCDNGGDGHDVSTWMR